MLRRACGDFQAAARLLDRILDRNATHGRALRQYAITGRAARRAGHGELAVALADRLSRLLAANVDLGSPIPAAATSPSLLGGANYYLRRHTYAVDGDKARTIVEKCVAASCREVAFWKRYHAGTVTGTDIISINPPMAMVERHGLAVLFFHWIDAPRTTRAVFRQNLWRIVDGVAAFNARNLLSPPRSLPFDRRRLPTPSTERLRATFPGVPVDELRRTKAALDALAAEWPVVRRWKAQAQWCLSHNDVHTANVFITDDAVHLLDWGSAGPAPVGSDLHKIIWFTGQQATAAGRQQIVERYTQAARAHGLAIDEEQVRLAMLTAFVRANLDPAHKAARHFPTFQLALELGVELVESLGRRV